MTWSNHLQAVLTTAGLDPLDVDRLVTTAFEEDLRYGPDVTTRATIPPGARASADVVARRGGVVAGVPVALAVWERAGLDAEQVAVASPDGSRVDSGQVVLTVTGPVPPLLTAERTVLNFLTHLSGVASATRAWVDAVAGTGATVRDTRKTLPGLRDVEKYAVRCGGGANHRLGLGDAVLLKDNHVAAAGGVAQAIAALDRDPAVQAGLPLEVECDTVEQVREAVEAGARIVLLDNMGLDQLRQAVAVARSASKGRVLLEASGGLRLDTARQVAETGVDYLAVGELTHSAPVLDLGMDLRQVTPG